MGQVERLEDWNDIIQRVNDLSQDPDEGCDSLSLLEEAEAPHIWSVFDITQVQDKLKEICKDNEFEADLRLWNQEIIDEIESGISMGWCDCEAKCDNEADPSNIVIATNGMFGPSLVPEVVYAGYTKGMECRAKIDEWYQAEGAWCTIVRRIITIDEP
jgi:hypothetical protein